MIFGVVLCEWVFRWVFPLIRRGEWVMLPPFMEDAAEQVFGQMKLHLAPLITTTFLTPVRHDATRPAFFFFFLFSAHLAPTFRRR